MAFFVCRKYYLIVAACFLFACQKELDEDLYTPCLMEQVDIFEGNAPNAAETYTYEYDATTSRANAIIINVPPLGFYRRINITYIDGGIDLGATGFIGLDGAGRVEHLRVDNAFPGSDTGDYFYGYHTSGFLSDRLNDDLVNPLQTTEFDDNGNTITQYGIGFGGTPPIAVGSLSYFSAPTIHANSLLPYADIFPELMPFFPIIKLGRISNLPLEKITLNVATPNQNPVSILFQNSSFGVNEEGGLISFNSAITVPGFQPLTRRFQLKYSCE